MRTKARWLIALLAVMAIFAAACSDDDDGDTSTEGTTAGSVPSGPQIVIGAQDFGESAILAEIYGQALAANGYDVAQQSLGGFRDIEIAAFESDEINFAPEYVASMLEFLNEQAGEATSDVDETLGLLQTALEPLGLVALEPAPGVDTNAFVITKETSESLGITTLSDLAEKGGDLSLGGPADCETNPFCIPGLQEVYGVDFSANFTGLDTGVIATALTNGEIDVAVLFSTDGRIVENEWVLLEDDQTMLAADNIVPVVTQGLVDAYGDDMADLVNSISAKLTTEALTDMNKQYDVDKESASDIATSWLEENGFL
jgi:osmoprotectant transport system substrate-binding protein